MINNDDVRVAAHRIGERVRRTPVFAVDAFAVDAQTWCKLEYVQHVGSFKARGMLNQVLAAAERGTLPEAGIIAASGGNAGLAAAYAARQLNVPAEVYVPLTAPPVKVEKLRDLGAQVTQVGSEYADAYAAAMTRAATTGARFCHAYDDPDMIAGNGTVGLELLDQLPQGFDTVLVAVGGGGLIGGMIAALREHAKIVAVEPMTAPTLHEALRHGGPVDVGVSGVAADSLGARRVGTLAYELAVDAGVPSVLVDDQAIIDARRRLWADYRVVVEHGAATAQAALTGGCYQPAPGERVVVLLCGANTSPTDLT